MRRCLWSGTLLLLASTAPALAQAFPTDQGFWQVTPFVGFFAPEEPEGSEIEGQPLFGARVGYRRAAGFGVELHGAFTPLELDIAGNPPEEIELPTFLYGADVLYAWAINSRSDFFVSAGAGGITWSPDGLESETNLRVAFGAGVHYLLTSAIALRGELRDHIVFDQLADTARSLALADKGQTNNVEASVGVSFVLP